MKLISNYHTHTYRCGHAVGSDESYVLAAIDLGLKVLGFSDHISYQNHSNKGMRQDRCDLEDYVNSINFLKEKYKNQIEIHVGFEAEYIKEFEGDYRDLLKNKGIEYLILGQHGYLVNNEQVWYNSATHNKEALKKYIDDVIAGIKSGLFLYVAHPDHFMNGYQIWDDFAIRESKRLFEACEKYNIPLEINCAGLRYNIRKADNKRFNNYYPYDKFWSLASNYNIFGIIGLDAHKKEDFSLEIVAEAFEFCFEHNIKLIDKLKL